MVAASEPARACSTAAAKNASFTCCRSVKSVVADARLLLGELRALERALRADGRIEQPLIDADAAVVGVLRRR